MSRLNKTLSNITSMKKITKGIHKEPIFTDEQKEELIEEINNKILDIQITINQKISYMIRKGLK